MADTEGLRLFLALTMGSLALVLMAMAIIAFVLIHQRRVILHQSEMKKKDEAMQQELLRAVIQSQEEERRRIARDLHDDLGPMLSAVKLKLSYTGRQPDGNQNRLAELNEAKEMIDSAIYQVRGISHRLLPPAFEELGLVSAIENSCRKMSNECLELEVKLHSEYIRFDSEMELALYRVIMELLNNIVKHSKATKATVSFMQNENDFEIKVADNGIGFDTQAPYKNVGLGIRNVQSRLSAINALFSYQALPGNGTVVIITSQPEKSLVL